MDQPIIAFIYKSKSIMPDGSIGSIEIGEFSGDRSKDLCLTLAQAKTLRDQISRILGD